MLHRFVYGSSPLSKKSNEIAWFRRGSPGIPGCEESLHCIGTVLSLPPSVPKGSVSFPGGRGLPAVALGPDGEELVNRDTNRTPLLARTDRRVVHAGGGASDTPSRTSEHLPGYSDFFLKAPGMLLPPPPPTLRKHPLCASEGAGRCVLRAVTCHILTIFFSFFSRLRKHRGWSLGPSHVISCVLVQARGGGYIYPPPTCILKKRGGGAVVSRGLLSAFRFVRSPPTYLLGAKIVPKSLHNTRISCWVTGGRFDIFVGYSVKTITSSSTWGTFSNPFISNMRFTT